MSVLRPLFFMCTVYGLTLALLWTSLQSLHPGWWSRAWVRRSLAFAPVLGLCSVLLWMISIPLDMRRLGSLGATSSGLLAVALMLVLGSVWAAALWRWMLGKLLLPARAVHPSGLSQQTGLSSAEAPSADVASTGAAPSHAPPTAPLPAEVLRPEHLSRRAFIGWTTSALPVAALASSGSGVLMAAQPQRLPTVTFYWPELPSDLEGLRILHLSDLHLGIFTEVRDLALFLERAAAQQPDLIVFTGDVADDLEQLGPAMREAASLRPRLGVLASIGNHEYFRGIKAARRIYDASSVPLLLSSGLSLQVGQSTLTVGGADDPVHLAGRHGDFMKETADRAFDGAPSDAFQLFLCHRPEGFIAAAERGIHLTLSGHTHGGQLGKNGRSVFEPVMKERFLWGPYERGHSQLYTSSGFGHWFPFRVGCPAEAPLIVLRQGQGLALREEHCG